MSTPRSSDNRGERHGRILAFGNLRPGPHNVELSFDLMRYHHDAPKGVMETLLVHVITWTRDHSFPNVEDTCRAGRSGTK